MMKQLKPSIHLIRSTLCILVIALAACGGEEGSDEDAFILDTGGDAAVDGDVDYTGDCATDEDCLSGVCDPVGGTCLEPTCSDSVQNQDEAGVDCGGARCRQCNAGEGCATAADCSTSLCDPGTLVCKPKPELCTDGVRNGNESDVDCGGPRCTTCLGGQRCNEDEDCASDFCNVSGFVCGAVASCADGAANGLETDVDCGGPCSPCAAGLLCAGDDDCASGLCQGARCAGASSCTDAVMNGAETDVDCGGPTCGPCLIGDACLADADCAPFRCQADACACDVGYAPDGVGGCAEVDECADPALNNCDVNATCSNTLGSYACACDPGYTGNGRTCAPVVNCQNDPGLCDDDAACVDQGSGRVCVCDPGYTGDGASCADVDECADPALNDCDVNATCSNVTGDFACACNDGFTGDGTACADINECDDLTACSPGALCANTQGGFTCACPPGLESINNGITCRPYASCDALHTAAPALGDGVYTIDPDGSGGDDSFEVYCDMTTQGGGWTLVMKIDGRTNQFIYKNNTMWQDTGLFNETATDLDRQEAKFSSYNEVPFSELLLGVETPIGATGSPLEISYLTVTLDAPASSLRSVIKDGGDRQTIALDAAAWTGWIGDGFIEPNCTLSAFNAKEGNDKNTWARIGIIGDDNPQCKNPDSAIGLGTNGGDCNPGDNSAGNLAGCSAGSFVQPGFGFIFVR